MPAAAAIIALPTLNGVTPPSPPLNVTAGLRAMGSTKTTATQQIPVIGIGASVITLSEVNVRATPAGALLGIQPVGAIASVIAGPVTKKFNNIPVIWWSLKFPSGVNGYVGLDNLKLTAPSPPPPTTYLVWIKALSAAAPGMTTTQVSSWLTTNPPKSD